MTIHRRTGLILAGIAGALLLACVFAVPALLDADRYRPRVISYLERSTGKTVEIGRLAVTLLPSIAIHVDDFGIRSPPLFPPGYILKVARIDVQIDPWALLHRQILIRSVLLDQPVINLVSDPDGPWNFENPRAKSSPSSLPLGVISRVKIRRARVSVSNLLPSDMAGAVFLEANEVSSELENVNVDAIVDPASRTLDGQGTLQAGLLRFGSIQIRHFGANLRLEARRVVFTELKAQAYGGYAQGGLAIKFSRNNASFDSYATVKRIDVALLLDAFPNARGKMTGKMEGDLKIGGEIAHSAHPLERLHGSGHLIVRDGKVPSLKLNANLMKLAHYNDLGPARNDPSSFKSVSTDLELDHQRISSKVIDIDGYGVDVDASGSVSVSGSDELSYQGVAQIVSKQGFMTNLLGRLAGGTVQDGKLSFPFHVGGTIDNPVFGKGN